MIKILKKFQFFPYQKALFHIAAFSHPGIQDLFANAQRLWCHFKELVGVDEVECLLQTEDARRSEPECFIGAG